MNNAQSLNLFAILHMISEPTRLRRSFTSAKLQYIRYIIHRSFIMPMNLSARLSDISHAIH
jgi:hypothetical protein